MPDSHKAKTPDPQVWSVTVKQEALNDTKNVGVGGHTEQHNYWKWLGVVRVLLSSVCCW